MDANILQRFLDVGLFDIGDDDGRLKIFHDAANDLATAITKDPQKAVSATLVALDPNVPDEEPVLEEVEAAVREHWKAFRNKYPERPKGLLRPVLLQALEKASTESVEISSVMWLVGINLLPRLEEHKERALVKELLDTKGILTEAEAEKIWAPGDQIDLALPKITVKLSNPAVPTVNRDALTSAMVSAAGGTPHGNSHWPQQNPNAWRNEFGQRSAVAIADVIEAGLKPLAQQTGTFAEQIEPAMRKIGKDLTSAIQQWVTDGVKSVRQRSQLLWWKEALYSPALRSSYRGLSPAELAISMAHDLRNISAAPAPQSVEYFLRETVKAVLPQDSEVSVAQVLEEAQRSKIVQPVTPPSSAQRVCLLTSLGYSQSAAIPVDTLPAWLGVRGDLRLPCSELAMWLFRDAQALSLADKESGK
jgi:hypothetical protein